MLNKLTSLLNEKVKISTDIHSLITLMLCVLVVVFSVPSVDIVRTILCIVAIAYFGFTFLLCLYKTRTESKSTS